MGYASKSICRILKSLTILIDAPASTKFNLFPLNHICCCLSRGAPMGLLLHWKFVWRGDGLCCWYLLNHRASQWESEQADAALHGSRRRHWNVNICYNVQASGELRESFAGCCKATKWQPSSWDGLFLEEQTQRMMGCLLHLCNWLLFDPGNLHNSISLARKIQPRISNFLSQISKVVC